MQCHLVSKHVKCSWIDSINSNDTVGFIDQPQSHRCVQHAMAVVDLTQVFHYLTLHLNCVAQLYP